MRFSACLSNHEKLKKSQEDGILHPRREGSKSTAGKRFDDRARRDRKEKIERLRGGGTRIGVTVSVGTLASSLMDEPSRNAFIIQQESRAIMQGAKQLAKKSEFSRNAISANFHGNKLKRRNTPRGKLNRYQPKT